MTTTRQTPARIAAAGMLVVASAVLAACVGGDDIGERRAELPVGLTLAASNVGTTAVDLRWWGVDGEPSRYEVFVDGALYTSTAPDRDTARVTPLSSATRYCFFVTAWFEALPGGNSGGIRSNEVCATTLAGP